MATIRIYYDDQPNDVVDKISSELDDFGLTIEEVDSGDGYIIYEVKKIEQDEVH